jgi:hypothetical protein
MEVTADLLLSSTSLASQPGLQQLFDNPCLLILHSFTAEAAVAFMSISGPSSHRGDTLYLADDDCHSGLRVTHKL